MPKFLIPFLTAVLMLNCVSVRAQVVALDPALQGQPLGGYLACWQDVGGHADLPGVMANTDWQPVTTDVVNFGLVDTPYWFRLELQVADTSSLWLLSVEYPLLDNIDFYLVNDTGRILDQRKTGFIQARSANAFKHRTFVFPLNVSKPGVVVAYFRVRSLHSLQFPLVLWQSRNFIEQDEAANLFLGIFFGVLGILLLYNFFLYALLRDRLYLMFACMALSALLFEAQSFGLGPRFLWPQHRDWSSGLLLANGMVAAFFIMLFADYFLALEKKRFPLLKPLRMLRWLGLVTGLMALWIHPEMGVRLLLGLALLTAFITSYAVLYCYRSADRPYGMFGIGWIMLVFSILLTAANKLGLLPFNAITEQGASVCSLAALVLFSMALGDRSQRDSERRLREGEQQLHQLNLESEWRSKQVRSLEMQHTAGEISLRLQTESNERLAREIDLRDLETGQIQQRLQDLSRMDAQTTVFNRVYFNERFREEFERAARSRQQLSLVLAQLDQFTSIGESMGMRASDDIVRQTAEVIESVTRHHCASLYRYEEATFAVLMPATGLQRAQAVAEMIRSAFHYQPFLFAGNMLQLTLSLGVGSLTPKPGESPESLLLLADNALREAQQQGRDCVRVLEQKAG